MQALRVDFATYLATIAYLATIEHTPCSTGPPPRDEMIEMMALATTVSSVLLCLAEDADRRPCPPAVNGYVLGEPCARLEPPNQDAGDGAGHGRDHQGTHSQKHSLLCLCLYIANVLSTDGVENFH